MTSTPVTRSEMVATYNQAWDADTARRDMEAVQLGYDADAGRALLAELDAAEKRKYQDYRLDDDFDTNENSEATDYRFGLVL